MLGLGALSGMNQLSSGCCQFLKRKELMLVRDGAKADGFKRSFPDVLPFNPTTLSSLGLERESGKENSLHHKPSPDMHHLPQFSQTPGTQGQEFHFYRESHGGSDRLRKLPRVTQPPKSNSGECTIGWLSLPHAATDGTN